MRISRVPTDQAAPEIRQQLEAVYRLRGNVPNMFRTMAHRPRLLRTMLDHFAAVMDEGTVTTKLKELLAMRVSQINVCDY